MTPSTVLNLIFALLILLGGGMGFAKKGSLPSLLGSLMISTLYLVAFNFKRSLARTDVWNRGKTVAVVASGLLLLIGVMRYMSVEVRTLPILFISMGSLGLLIEIVFV